MRYQDGKTFIKIIIVTLVVAAIAGYSYFQARNLINGPEITIESPANGATLTDQRVTITGTAKNISYISLNDRQIFVDNDGVFREDLLLGEGYNIWKLEAKDKFGRVVSKNIELVLSKNL